MIDQLINIIKHDYQHIYFLKLESNIPEIFLSCKTVVRDLILTDADVRKRKLLVTESCQVMINPNLNINLDY